MTKLSDVKAIQPNWFSKENKTLFGDIRYLVLHGKTSKKPFLVRETYAWSDMFGGEKKVVFRINKLEEDLKIGDMMNEVFKSLKEVKEYLKQK